MDSRMQSMSAIPIWAIVLASCFGWGPPAAAVGPGGGEAPSAIKVYIDGRPGSVDFPKQLPLSMRERALAGEFITHERGKVVVVMPLGSPPRHFAQVVLRETGARSYTNKVDELPTSPYIVKTMAMDIPSYGVSVLTFVSRTDPKAVVRTYCAELQALSWKRLSWPTDQGREGSARLVKNGNTIELRVQPQSQGSIGTLWLNYYRSRW